MFKDIIDNVVAVLQCLIILALMIFIVSPSFWFVALAALTAN